MIGMLMTSLFMFFPTQDWEEMRQKMTQAMQDMDNVKMTVELEKNNDFENIATMWKAGNSWRMKYDTYETLINERYFVSIAHDFQQILWQKLDQNKRKKSSPADNILDSRIGKRRNMKVSETDSEFIIESVGDDQTKELILIKLEKDTYRIKYFEFHGGERLGNQVTKVRYRYELLESDAVFDESQFLKVDKGEVIPVEAYSNYSVGRTTTLIED
ncbi:MAG: hypothetical protein JXR03_04930 [Cyclobacteriaceae bacterium]